MLQHALRRQKNFELFQNYMGVCIQHLTHPTSTSDKVLTVAENEIPLLEQITPKEIKQIDKVRSRVITPSQTFDVDSLFHLQQVSFH